LIIDDDKLSCKILEGFIEKTEGISLANTYYSPVGALNEQDWGAVDLVFLDIEMPDMTGLDFLQTVDNSPQIIIVSSNEKYAIDAFDFSVTDFLLKPLNYARFYKGVQKALNLHQPEHGDPVAIETILEEGVFVKKNNSLFQITYEEIIWIEALENYSAIFTAEDKFIVHSNLKAVEAKLPEQYFKRVHRSNIVNVKHIKSIEDKFVSMALKNRTHRIPVGKSYRDKLLNNIKSL